MASILTQVYKEAATTAKGVVQMNRTLTKIYDDQIKANKAQAKFFDDLRRKNQREERDKKKEQSDLRKILSGQKSSNNKPGGDEDEDTSGIFQSIIDGIGSAFGVLKDILIGAIGTKLLSFASKFFKLPKLPKLPKFLRPRVQPPKGTKGKNGGKGKGKGKGGGKGGKPTKATKPTKPTKPATTSTAKPPATQPAKPPTNSGNQQVTPRAGNPRLPTPPTPTEVPKPQLSWWDKIKNQGAKIGKQGKNLWKTISKNPLMKKLAGVKGVLGKLLGPVVIAATMLPTMIDLWKKKEYKNLARYVIASAAGVAVGSATATAMTGLAALVGLPTAGVGAVPVFIAGMAAAAGAGGFTYEMIDGLLEDMGLADEDKSTDREMEVIPIETSDLEDAAQNKDKIQKQYDERIKEETTTPVQNRQRGGGIFDVPGHGQGDQVPMMLPPGAFVLNRVAAGEMFARGGSPSGMVPTLLEPGEKVFMPGDPMMEMAMMFNDTYSRFQRGGTVDDGASRGSSQPRMTEEATPGQGKGVKAILSAAEANIGMGKGVGEQCANTTRSVLKASGHPAGTKVTQKGDLDPEGTKYNGPGFAASFAGSDMGTVNKKFNNVKPGEVMLWKDTYKQTADQPPGSVTHVGIAGEGNVQYDHSRDRGWEKAPRESNNFLASIDLNGEASGGENQDSTDTSGGNVLSGLGGAMSSITSALSSVFAPITDAVSSGNPFGEITSMLSKEMSAITDSMKEKMSTPEMKQIQEDMKNEITKMTGEMSNSINRELTQGRSEVTKAPQVTARAMQRIREMKDPEADGSNEQPTIVQVVPSKPSGTVAASGTANQNLPPGLSVRCPSWAAADYRYDRSLNTPTL